MLAGLRGASKSTPVSRPGTLFALCPHVVNLPRHALNRAGMADRRSRLELGAWRPGRPKSGPSRLLRRRCRRRRQFRERCIPLFFHARRLFVFNLLLMWFTRGPTTAHALHFSTTTTPLNSLCNPLCSAFLSALAWPIGRTPPRRRRRMSLGALVGRQRQTRMVN